MKHARPSLFLEGMLLLTPMARIKHSDGVTTFSFFWTFAFFYGYHPHTSPLRFSFWDTGFRFFDSFLRGKSGVDVGICCADDGRPPAWKEDWFGAFGVKAV